MNNLLEPIKTTTVYSNGTPCPRNHCVVIDNVVDTFRITFHDHHEEAEIMTIVKQFHEVVSVGQEDDKIFQVRTRSMGQGLSADSINHILNPFYGIAKITHIHRLVVAQYTTRS